MMEMVHSFNQEMRSLYDLKPPISKSKIHSITKGAIRAISLYKHVVHSVEKFIEKCKPEYKIPGLYVIDSIVRQSRLQFGPEKDVFAPRFAKNMQITFFHLFKCPEGQKREIVRVLNLWQMNNVFRIETIQTLFKRAGPYEIHRTLGKNTDAGKSVTEKRREARKERSEPRGENCFFDRPSLTEHGESLGIYPFKAGHITGMNFRQKTSLFPIRTLVQHS